MYWYFDDRSVQFSFNRPKSGRNRAFYGHWSSLVFLTYILKYRLDRQLGPIPFLVDLVDMEIKLVLVRILKTVDLAGLQGLRNLHPFLVEGFAYFEEILAFTEKKNQNYRGRQGNSTEVCRSWNLYLFGFPPVCYFRSSAGSKESIKYTLYPTSTQSDTLFWPIFADFQSQIISSYLHISGKWESS